MLLDDASKECLTISTHRGLFQPTRLQFGVHSATGIFQREMEKRLSHVPKLVVRIDDILLAGTDQTELLLNLEKTLMVLRNCGLRLRKEKCVFLASEVVFLGFLIDSQGVRPIESKLKPILDLPIPQDVTQLK